MAVLIAGEMVAAVALAAQQNAAGASIERQISVAVGAIAVLTFLWAVARFVLKPMLHSWIFAVMEHEPARFTDVVIEGLDKNDRTRATTRGFIDRLYADKIAADQETRDMAEQNKDAIRFLEESNSRQGEAITKELATAMKAVAQSNDNQTRSNESQTRIMDEIRKELNALAKAYERLDERQQHYEGPERRKPR
jgi:uncharacterized protein YbcC (UPF0753/DUF2309 family)